MFRCCVEGTGKTRELRVDSFKTVNFENLRDSFTLSTSFNLNVIRLMISHEHISVYVTLGQRNCTIFDHNYEQTVTVVDQ